MNPQKTQAQYLYKSPGMVCPQYTNMHYHRTEKSEGVWGQFIFKIFIKCMQIYRSLTFVNPEGISKI